MLNIGEIKQQRHVDEVTKSVHKCLVGMRINFKYNNI